METIDGRRALELLTDVVDTFGRDFVYQPQPYCAYVRDGAPSCIVGHVLFRAGWTIEQLEELDPRSCAGERDWRIAVPASQLGFIRGSDVDHEASRILEVAQDCQDGGRPWGMALDRARRHYEDMKASEGFMEGKL